jgi:hypothetical protein
MWENQQEIVGGTTFGLLEDSWVTRKLLAGDLTSFITKTEKTPHGPLGGL